MNDSREIIESLPLIWRNLMRQFSLNLESAIPAVVISYDRTNNMVTCRGAVNRIDADGNSYTRTEMEVPCFNPCGSGIGINFPLAEGDTGWVVAADRDTTNFQNTRAVSDPNSLDLHRYSFGFFIPDIIHGFTINPDDAGALVIETTDAATRISIKDQRVKITRNNVSLETNGFYINLVTPSSTITVADDGTVTMKATQININGLCSVSTGATGVISLASVATVSNGIVTAIY